MGAEGTYIFASADTGKAVVITYTYAASAGIRPNLTPVYALTDLDFVDEKGNKDPVQVERADVFSLPTIQRLEVSSRGNQYASMPVEARDQAQIEIFGPRVGSPVQGHEICDELRVGPLVAQTILQRELYVRAKFTFKLSWEYCLLDPMDIVTLTDANLGLSDYPVRIIAIEEDDKGLLAFTAEELVFGVSTPAFYQTAAPGNFAANWAVPAVAGQHAADLRAAVVGDRRRRPGLGRGVRDQRRSVEPAMGRRECLRVPRQRRPIRRSPF